MRRRLFAVYINLGDAPQGPELALNIVIDDSGSMAGDPIAEVRNALRVFIESAPEGTRLGLIGFGSDVHVYAEPTEYREFLLDQVDRFQGHSGSTMLYEAVGEACLRFQGDGRHRYVLVLTDGGDTGSPQYSLEGGDAKRDLVRHAIEQDVKVYAIGFGSVDRQSLEKLARSTGGEYLEATGIQDLLRTFERFLGMIDKDRNAVRLRPEFSRLLSDSCGGDPPWLRHLSIDEWDQKETWSDATHLKFPKPSNGNVSTYVTFAEQELDVIVRAKLERIALDQLRGSEDRAAPSFPLDFDVFIVGWLADPAFRAISIHVLKVFDALHKKLSAQLAGDMHPFLIPLVAGVGGLAPEVRAECYAWLHGVSNALGRGALRALISFGETNQERRRNPLGFIAADEARMLWQGANSLRCHALYTSHLTRLATPEENGGLMIHSGGAASLCAPLAELVRRSALDSYSQLLDLVLAASSRPGDANQTASEMFQTGRLNLDAVIGELLQPVEIEAPEGILASIRLDVSRFWPPSDPVPEEEYLRLLPRLLDERASDYLFHKLEALRRVLNRRVADKLRSVRTLVMSKTDSILFGSDAGAIALAGDTLARLRSLIQEQQSRVHESNVAASQFERSRIFAQEEAAVRSDGVLSREAAAERLVDLLRWRPSRTSLIVRHSFLAVSVGAIVQKVSAWLLRVGTDGSLGSFGVSLGVGSVAGLTCLLLGFTRWRLARQRIGTAIAEYVYAAVREARARAMDETLSNLRYFYNELAAWIGESDVVPDWDPAETRSETTLSQRQILTCLRSALEADLHARERRWRDNPGPVNPSVWQMGSTVSDPQVPGGATVLQVPALASDPLSWISVADRGENHNWREVCRRRLCDTLQAYLDFHRERVRLGQRIFDKCIRELTKSLSAMQTLGRMVTAGTVPELPKVLERLDSIAFPPLQLTYSTAVPSPRASTMVDPQEAATILDSFPANQGLHEKLKQDGIALQNRSELHRLWTMTAPISESVDWQACRAAWEALDEPIRRSLLAPWGDVGTWRNPLSGDLVFPVSEPEPTAHESVEGGL